MLSIINPTATCMLYVNLYVVVRRVRVFVYACVHVRDERMCVCERVVLQGRL